MSTIPGVFEALREVLTQAADRLAVETGFIKRQCKMSGPLFVQTVVMTWLAQPCASLEAMVRKAAVLGLDISAQGLDNRFGPEAAELLRGVLEAAIGKVVESQPARVPLLERFTSVQLEGSTTITLPDALADVFAGCGGRTENGTQAAMKLQLQYDLLRGSLHGPYVQDGRTSDNSAQTRTVFEGDLPEGGLRIADLGYFRIEGLEHLSSPGRYYLTRLKGGCGVYEVEGKRRDVLDLLERTSKRTGQDRVDLPVRIGQERHACRLLGARVPEMVAEARRRRLRQEARRKGSQPSRESLRLTDWSIFVTDVPLEMLNVEEAIVLAAARWQIELLFKLWKQDGRVDEWRTADPWRILCEVYAKLVAVLIQHWLVLMGSWEYVDRSLVKAAQAVRESASLLAAAMAGRIPLPAAADAIQAAQGPHGCRMNSRSTKPNTYQRLLQPALEPLP